MELSFLGKIRYWVLLLLIALITISSHPIIVDMSRAAGMESGTILSRYIILVFAGLFLLCFNLNSMLGSKVVRTSLFIMAFILLYAFIVASFFGTNVMISYARTIAVCVVAIMVGWHLDLDRKRFNQVLLLFAGLTLFVGLMQVVMNIGGFEIHDQYETDNKNSLGVMLATSGTIFLVMAFNSKSKRFVQLVMYGLAILTFVVLLTIRARASALTGVIVLLYILYERYKGKNFWFYFLVGIMVITLVFICLPGSMKQYVYSSFFKNFEEGDITSGRMDRNIAALEFLSSHIFLGNLTENISIGWIHNYPLNKMFEFGLVFSFPILVLYLYLLFKAIVKTIRSDNHNNYNLGYYLLLIPFIISMAEPTFPFGPGTATVFNFIVFGAALRNTENERIGSVPNIVFSEQES